METKTTFSQIEIMENGIVQLRIRKQVVDGSRELAGEYHRLILQPGADVDASIADANGALAAMGYPPIPADCADRVRRIVALEHSPEVVAAFKGAAQ